MIYKPLKSLAFKLFANSSLLAFRVTKISTLPAEINTWNKRVVTTYNNVMCLKTLGKVTCLKRYNVWL
jgi:hypothetical protein